MTTATTASIDQFLLESNEKSKEILSIQEQISQHLEAAALLAKELNAGTSYLNDALKKAEQISLDNMHLLELLPMNAVDLVRIAKNQKQVLQTRRIIKDTLEDMAFYESKTISSLLRLPKFVPFNKKDRAYRFRSQESFEFGEQFKSFQRLQQSYGLDFPSKQRFAEPKSSSVAIDDSTSHSINYLTPYHSNCLTTSLAPITVTNHGTSGIYDYCLTRSNEQWKILDVKENKVIASFKKLYNLFTYVIQAGYKDMYIHHSVFSFVVSHIKQIVIGEAPAYLPLPTLVSFFEENFQLKIKSQVK